MTAEEYLTHLIEIAVIPGAVQQSHLELLQRLIKEGQTGVYVP